MVHAALVTAASMQALLRYLTSCNWGALWPYAVPVAATEPHCRGGPLFKVPGHHRPQGRAGGNSPPARVIIRLRHWPM